MRLIPLSLVAIGEYFIITEGDNTAKVYLRVEDPAHHTTLPVLAIPVDMLEEDADPDDFRRFTGEATVLV